MASISFDGTLGALLIGVIGCGFLFGIVTVQVYIYSRAYPNDSKFIKLLAATVWLLELGHTIATSHAVYLEIIKKFGNPALLARMPNSMAISILMEGLVTFLVEGFFVFRIYCMYRTHYFAIFCWFLASLRLVASIAYFIVCFVPPANTELFTVFEDKWSWLVETLQIMGAAIDVLIAIALCMYYMRNNDTTFAGTKKLIDKLLMWAICEGSLILMNRWTDFTQLATGLLTSLVSVLSVICFLTMPNNLVWIIMYIWLAKVYSNSLLATLNARNGLREAGKHGVFLSKLSQLKNTTENSMSTAQFPTRVNIETDTFVLNERSNDKTFASLTPSNV